MARKNRSKQRSAVVEKSFLDGAWGTESASGGGLTVNAIAQKFRNLSANDCFQLVCSVRTALDSISKNLRKAQWRLFTRNGDEIEDGPIFDLLRRPSPDLTGAQLTEEMAYWWCLENEIALKLIPGSGEQSISAMLPMNPQRLFINSPRMGLVNHVYQIEQWRYFWFSGVDEYIRADYVAYDHGWNPVNPVRGISPLVTGQNWAGLSHYLSQHNLNFFQNSAIPSHMVVLPAGTSKSQREEFEQRYMQQFGAYTGQAHKIMIASGGEVKIEKLDRDPKEGEFLELEKLSTDKIAGLYKVPELEMGTTREVRFESAQAQRQVFHDSTLCPLAERLGQFMQRQIVDRHFADYRPQRSSRNAIGKRLEKSYADALNASPGSDVIVILDTDTMPIVGQIRKDTIGLIKEVRESTDLSANEAAEFVGIDLPTGDAANAKLRDKIFVPSGRVCLNDPQMFAPPAARAGDAPPPKNAPPNQRPTSAKPRVDQSKELTEDQRKNYRRFEVAYRRLLLETKGRFKLKDADALTDDPKLRSEIRRDYFWLHDSGLAKGNDPTPEIKAYLNSKYDQKFYREIANVAVKAKEEAV